MPSREISRETPVCTEAPVKILEVIEVPAVTIAKPLSAPVPHLLREQQLMSPKIETKQSEMPLGRQQEIGDA